MTKTHYGVSMFKIYKQTEKSHPICICCWPYCNFFYIKPYTFQVKWITHQHHQAHTKLIRTNFHNNVWKPHISVNLLLMGGCAKSGQHDPKWNHVLGMVTLREHIEFEVNLGIRFLYYFRKPSTSATFSHFAHQMTNIGPMRSNFNLILKIHPPSVFAETIRVVFRTLVENIGRTDGRTDWQTHG